MNAVRFLWCTAFAAILGQSGWLAASELESVDRTIGKQPAYVGEPLYALAVFGREAATRMWLVVDRSSAQAGEADMLYVDLDGDGDLTDPQERIESQADTSRFSLPVLDAGDGAKHTDFSLRLSSGAQPTHMLSLKWRGEHKLGGGYPVDPENGYMQFGKSPQEAPVVWFNGDGPFRFQPWYNDPMGIGGETDLKVFLGQVGSGASAFCAFQEHVLPEEELVIATLIYTDQDGRQREAASNLDRRC